MRLSDIDLGELTTEQLNALQRDVSTESNRRLRVAAIPSQIRDVIADARAGGEIPDETIRRVFEEAMGAPTD